MTTVQSSSRQKIPKPNLCGLFAGDWASEEKVSLLAETFTVFSSLQRIAEEQDQQRRQAVERPSSSSFAGASLSTLLPPVQTLQYYHRIANLYREALKRFISTLELSDDEDDSTDLDVTQSLHIIFHFAETLYIPSDGRGNGVVGEEILHWLNSFDFAPRTEDGQAIAQSATPYDHGAFWDYILRCVLRGFHNSAASLLSSLATGHSSPTLRRIAKNVCGMLSSMPRSTTFTLEHDFLAAHRRWIGSVRSLLNKLEQDMDEMELELERESDGVKSREDIEDERLEYEAQFRCLLELMAGVKERVFEACEDWKEALGAWGVLVQPSLKRDDVPQIIDTVTQAFPIDATVPSDVLLHALAQGDVRSACKHASKLDPWLAAHMTDLLDRVGVLEDEGPEDDATMGVASAQEVERVKSESLRIQLIKVYAETVLDDQGLWRLAVDYLSYCGPSARRRMRFILLDVPFSAVHSGKSNQISAKRAEDVEADALDAEMEEEADDPDEAAELRRQRKESDCEAKRVSEEDRAAMEIIRTCVELGMSEEARAVCKRMSVVMVKQNRMGPALAYCVRAHDVRQIRRIVDAILQIYIDLGMDEFGKAVDSIPFSLLNKAAKQADASIALQQVLAERELLGTDVEADHDALAPMIEQNVSLVAIERLLFLVRYRDFHRLYSEGSFRSAATLLVELLTSNTAPERFRAVLLVDAIPLLQSDRSVVSSEESYELLRVLDIIATTSASHHRQAFYHLGMLERLLSGNKDVRSIKGALAKDDDDDDHDDNSSDNVDDSFDARSAIRRLNILRLALVRHLARSVVIA